MFYILFMLLCCLVHPWRQGKQPSGGCAHKRMLSWRKRLLFYKEVFFLCHMVAEVPTCTGHWKKLQKQWNPVRGAEHDTDLRTDRSTLLLHSWQPSTNFHCAPRDCHVQPSPKQERHLEARKPAVPSLRLWVCWAEKA